MWLNLIYIAVGASLGAISRYAIHASALPKYMPTFTVNILGSLFFGIISGYLTTKTTGHHHVIRLTLLVGFLGSFTTFSTFTHEITHAIKDQQYFTASLNLITQNSLGISAIFLGLKIASWMSGPDVPSV